MMIFAIAYWVLSLVYCGASVRVIAGKVNNMPQLVMVAIFAPILAVFLFGYRLASRG